MPLPDRIRVKLSSEAAESISLTPVVVQEIATRELVEHMLGVTGKDEARVRELLRRGTLVSGASRFRWSGWEADPEGVLDLLATFPDPEPERPFAGERAVRAILRGGRQPIEIPRAAALRKPLFRRGTFWNLLLEVAAGAMQYHTYSYKDRTDVYQGALDLPAANRLRGGAGLITYSALREKILNEPFTSAEFFVER